MAEGWIKMRGSLLQSPKLIRMTRILEDDPEFREWLTPGGPNGTRIISLAALKCVTLSLCTVTWSALREFGKFEDSDLFIERFTIRDLSEIAGAPGFGQAMESVGWAKENKRRGGVTLPNFKQYNVPLSGAERQQALRDRRRLS